MGHPWPTRRPSRDIAQRCKFHPLERYLRSNAPKGPVKLGAHGGRSKLRRGGTALGATPASDAEGIRTFYNAYGAQREWERFDTEIGKVQLHVITQFLREWALPAPRVLDMGSGPGRFAIWLAREGCCVTLVDVSDAMISAARERIREATVEAAVEGIYRASLFDMEQMDLAPFDVVLCLGGVLNYYPDDMLRALGILRRLLAPTGRLVGSVMSTVGALASSLGRGWVPPAGVPGEALRAVYATGMLTDDFSPHPAKMLHAEELRQLLLQAGFAPLDLSASECLLSVPDVQLERLIAQDDAYRTLLDLEVDACRRMPDAGSHILFAAAAGR